jgi:1,4-dihydroxy-2-naphthoyl-CoA hydrolase
MRMANGKAAPVADSVSTTRADDAPDATLTAMVYAQMPYAAALGLQLVAITTEQVVGLADWAPERTTTGGVAHGGFLMACADAVGAIAAFANLPAGAAGTITIESKTNFFGPVRGGTVRLRATPVHVGGTTVVVQTDVVDDRDRLVCRTTQTQLALAAKKVGVS